MSRLRSGAWVTQIIGAVAAYAIADRLADGPATAVEIAAMGGLDPRAVFRLLRACASIGLVRCGEKRVFHATPLLATLPSNIPGSLRGVAEAWAAPDHWLPWGKFVDAIRAEAHLTVSVPGEEQRESPALQIDAAIFRNAMQEFVTGVTREVVKVLDPSRAKFAIDVGGANGALLHGLMAANPKLRGAVFDLPEILPAARAAATALGLAKRNLTFAGDFFVSVPSGDLYLLKHVLQNWDDAASEGYAPRDLIRAS